MAAYFQLEELRADIVDLKEMYREQVNLLVNKVLPFNLFIFLFFPKRVQNLYSFTLCFIFWPEFFFTICFCAYACKLLTDPNIKYILWQCLIS
jgi:hypothetical protein